MALTHEVTLAEYEKARDELRRIIDADDSSDEQMKKALAAVNTLSESYIDSHIASIEERTAQYQSFIQYMNGVIADLESAGPLTVVSGLKSCIDTAKQLIPVQG